MQRTGNFVYQGNGNGLNANAAACLRRENLEKAPDARRYISIDPGTTNLGFAILDCWDNELDNRLTWSVVQWQLFNLNVKANATKAAIASMVRLFTRSLSEALLATIDHICIEDQGASTSDTIKAMQHSLFTYFKLSQELGRIPDSVPIDLCRGDHKLRFYRGPCTWTPTSAR